MTINLLASGPQIWNVTVYRGDDRSFKLTFAAEVDADNVPTDTLDVTGWDISAQVRSYANAPAALVQFDVNVTDATSGIVIITLTAADMATLPARELVWDCQRTSPDVKTFWTGTFTVSADVTRPTP